MATEQTSAPEAEPSTDIATTEASSFTLETPSSTVASLPQNENYYAGSIFARLDKFHKALDEFHRAVAKGGDVPPIPRM